MENNNRAYQLEMVTSYWFEVNYLYLRHEIERYIIIIGPL